jgi:hypothetical protein
MPLCYFNKLRDVRLGNSKLLRKFLFRFVKIPRGAKNIPRKCQFLGEFHLPKIER